MQHSGGADCITGSLVFELRFGVSLVGGRCSTVSGLATSLEYPLSCLKEYPLSCALCMLDYACKYSSKQAYDHVKVLFITDLPLCLKSYRDLMCSVNVSA